MAIRLSPKEYSIMVLIAYDYAEIANRLNRSKVAITQSIERMFCKLHAHSKTELVIKALKLGLISVYNFQLPTDDHEGYC